MADVTAELMFEATKSIQARLVQVPAFMPSWSGTSAAWIVSKPVLN
jgi:hypothetical protein